MTSHASTPTIILIAGHWLGAWAWDDVRAHLGTDDSLVAAITLPGLEAGDPARTEATLDDQVEAIRRVIAELGGSREHPVVIVAHSGANAPVSLVLDHDPELIRRVVWVDSGPVAPGSIFAPGLPAEVQELPLPPFEVLAEQASIAGLSADVLARFRDRAVPQPGTVLRQPVVLVNDDRRKIPTTLICCSISGAQVLELARGGNAMFAEVAALEHCDVVDLPTGHWPMWSRPRDLAVAIRSAASRVS